MITVGVVVVVLAGGAGWLVAPRLVRFGETPSRWLDRRLVAVLSAVVAGCSTLVTSGPVALITFAILGGGCVWLALVDLATFRLPDVLVGPLYLVAIIGLGVLAIASHDLHRMLLALITGAVLLAGYFILGLITARLGLGDVKLAGLLGITLGWAGLPQSALGALAGFAVGALVAAALLITRRAGRTSDFPFGPSMIIGAVLGLALGPAVFPALG